MSKVKVLGTDKTSIELPAEVFGKQTNVPLIHQVVVAQLAAARQGTASTKTRGDVAGGGAKPWRQKGTGRARQGSRRAPQWTGGGIVHGPHPRDYAQRTPKKMIAAALAGALSDRAREGAVHVVKDFGVTDAPSTKTALGALSKVSAAKLLVVLDRTEEIAWMSLRNVPSIHVLAVDQLNAYDVLRVDDVVFTQAALTTFLTSKGIEVETAEDLEASPESAESADSESDTAESDSAESVDSAESAENAESAPSADSAESEEDEL